MKKNRILYACILFLAFLFVYFYGGKMPYIIFYSALALPVISFLHAYHIFRKFRFEQDLSKHFVVKGDTLNFIFIAFNNTMWMYPYINVKFSGSDSIFAQQYETKNFSLYPYTSKKFTFELECKYRGFYACGIESVTIEDLLGIFRFKRTINTTNYITVYPRVLDLDYFKVVSLSSIDSSLFCPGSYEDPSSVKDIRKYVQGDNLKKTHWKLTAKLNEMMVKNYDISSESSTTFILDLEKNNLSAEVNIILEDKIIEAFISLVHYYLSNSLPVNLMFSQKGELKNINANSPTEFKGIYDTFAKVEFNDEIELQDILDLYSFNRINRSDLIIFTSNLSYSLYNRLLKLNGTGGSVILIYVSPDEVTGIIDTETSRVLSQMPEMGIHLYRINMNEEITQILGA